MKFIRVVLSGLAVAIALAAALLVAAFVPAVQTWVAQMELAGRPGLNVSLGSLSAGLAGADVADLRLERPGATLTLPAVQVRFPLATAAWDRKIIVKSLVAKGWTLDLSHSPKPGNESAPEAPAPEGGAEPASQAPPEAFSAQYLERLLSGILGGWKLPCELSVDGVDLEGDVLVPPPFGTEPVRLHVIVKGGGIAAGRDGVLAIDASGVAANPELQVYAAAAHARLAVAMDSPRTLNRIGIRADLSIKGGSLPQDLAFTADASAARGAGEEAYAVDLSRGSRHLATLLGRYSQAAGQLKGTWKVDLQDSDLAPFFPNRPLPSAAVAGEGRFDSEAPFTRVHALGRLNAVASHLGLLAQPLDRLGAVTLDARFDLAHSGRSVRVDLLDVSLAGARPIAEVRSLQPFDIDERSGDVSAADPRGDWIEGAIRGLPLAWIAGGINGFSVAGGDAAGEFTVRAAGGRFALRSKTPLTAAGVSVRRAGRILGRELDVSLLFLAECAREGWQVQLAPLAVASAGQRLVTVEAKASRPAGAGQPTAIAGKWSADLGAPSAARAIPGIRWLPGRSAKGDFSASVAISSTAEGTLAVMGYDPGDIVTASVRAEVDAYGSVTFLAPVRIAFGSTPSQVSLEGSWTKGDAGPRVDVKLTGESVILEHLIRLAAPAAAAGGVLFASNPASGLGGPQAGAGKRDRTPFWGDWVGRLTVGFDRLTAGSRDFKVVGGTFDIDHGSLHLEDGWCELADRGVAKLEGSIAFDAAAEHPYRLQATGTIDKIEAASLFDRSKSGQEPAVEGRFAVVATLTGEGADLDDLAGRTEGKLRLTSTAGIIRLLKTNVAESLPEPATPVSDALDSVGSVVGAILGRQEPLRSGEIRLSKNTEAVLDFTYQISEIGYDQLTVTAIRRSDNSIDLADLAMTAPDERLTGSGRIAFVKGLPLAARPLSLEMQLGSRGRVAGLLVDAGLLPPRKDGPGYAVLSERIHLGGTLEHIDSSRWHDFLLKAALRKPEGAPRKPRSNP